MDNKKIKVILCGYNWSGCKALSILINRSDISDIYVYTHNSEYFIPSLKNLCKKYKVKYSSKKISKKNLPFKPDIIASVSYKYIIPSEVIKFTKICGFNIHPSILPYYKGCSSVTWSMINNEKFIGYTYHLINKKIDSGDILYQKKIELECFDLQSTAYYRVMFESLKNFNIVMNKILNGFRGRIQKKINKSYYSRGAPYDGKINPEWSIQQIERFIRAMIFPPMKPARYKNKYILNVDDYIKLKSKL